MRDDPARLPAPRALQPQVPLRGRRHRRGRGRRRRGDAPRHHPPRDSGLARALHGDHHRALCRQVAVLALPAPGARRPRRAALRAFPFPSLLPPPLPRATSLTMRACRGSTRPRSRTSSPSSACTSTSTTARTRSPRRSATARSRSTTSSSVRHPSPFPSFLLCSQWLTRTCFRSRRAGGARQPLGQRAQPRRRGHQGAHGDAPPRRDRGEARRAQGDAEPHEQACIGESRAGGGVPPAVCRSCAFRVPCPFVCKE